MPTLLLQTVSLKIIYIMTIIVCILDHFVESLCQLSGCELFHSRSPIIVCITDHDTPGIYAEGYIVFVCLFIRLYVCSLVRTSVTFVGFASTFCVKVSQVVYISATTYQKAFIFGP